MTDDKNKDQDISLESKEVSLNSDSTLEEVPTEEASLPKEEESSNLQKVSEKKPPEHENIKPEKTETFSSENWDIVVETYPFCQIKMIAKGKKSVVQNAHKLAIRKLAKEVSIPGFRKGKAPATILEKKFPLAVKQEWEQAFANIAAVEACALGHKNLSHKDAKITFHANHLDQDSGEIILFFEAYPEVPTIDPKQIELPQEALTNDIQVTDKDFEQELARVQQFLGEWKAVDRPIQENDFLILDIDDIDQDPPVKAFADINLKASKDGMSAWMLDLVLGKSKGDVVEGISKPDENASEDDKKIFTEKKVKIQIKEVSEAILPKIDEEFIKKLGLDNEESLHTKLRELIQEKKERENKENIHKLIQDKLVQNFPFPLPQSIWDKETNHRMDLKLQTPELEKRWQTMSDDEKKDCTRRDYERSVTRFISFLFNKQNCTRP